MQSARALINDDDSIQIWSRYVHTKIDIYDLTLEQFVSVTDQHQWDRYDVDPKVIEQISELVECGFAEILADREVLTETYQLNESIWDGLASLFKTGKSDANAVKQKAQQVGNSAKNAAQRGVDATKKKAADVKAGISNLAKRGMDKAKAGGNQIKSNAQNAYKTGMAFAAAGKAVEKIQSHAEQIVKLLQWAQSHNATQALGVTNDDLLGLKVKDLTRVMKALQSSLRKRLERAQQKGLFGGVGKAIKKG